MTLLSRVTFHCWPGQKNIDIKEYTHLNPKGNVSEEEWHNTKCCLDKWLEIKSTAKMLVKILLC